jgi:Tfp pilus assembly protein PilF
MVPEAILEMEKAVSLCPTFVDLRTRLGVLYKDSGDLTRAKEHFETAKNINPKYLQARVQLGVLLLSGGKTAEASEEFKAVLAEDPENKSAQTYLRIADRRSEHPPPASGEGAPPTSS